MVESRNIAVIGGGSWATAIVKMLLNNADKIHWWMRNEETVSHLKEFHHNPNYLRAVEFDPEKINPSTDLHAVIDGADILIVAIPSAFVDEVFRTYEGNNLKDKTIFSAIKGVVPEYNVIPARYFHKNFDVPYEQIGIISGPCHAEEVAMEKLSYLTLACQDIKKAEMMASLLSCRYIKTAVSDDIFGTELSAVLKNVFAVACGICHGLGYGDNFQAVLMANAIREIERFVDAVSPMHRDVKDSAYLGDLLVTAYSQFSRNRTFGSMIGKGYSVKSAQMEMNMVAEGYYAVKGIWEINKEFKVDLPITEAVYHIVYDKINARKEMKILADKLS